jgi:NAD(P)-dependent dehydrogenase (short-subunit alcohol dehydrogenase family)
MEAVDYKDAVVIITGGSSGIGAAMVKAFAEVKAVVYFLDIDEVAGEVLAESCKMKQLHVSFIPCDITRLTAFQKVVHDIHEKHGQINVLINNAGIAHVGNIEQTSEVDLQNLIDVNIKGVYHGILSVIPFMKEQGGGVILNVGSIAAEVALPDRFAYSMTKGAVHAMTYSVARDYLSYHIRCNCIAPARVHTPFVDGFVQKNFPGKEAETFEALAQSQPIGRMGTTREIADLAVYLCSKQASFITGSMIPIDGGFIRLNT